MGKGGGGSGGGGGGRGGRGGAKGAARGGGGGGGAAGAPATPAAGAGGKQIYDESPSQTALAKENIEIMMGTDIKAMEKLYDDLPPVANANRVITKDGIVQVGDKGAPKVSGPDLTPKEASTILSDAGAPPNVINGLAGNHGHTALSDIAKIVRDNPNAKYIDSGIEGAFFEWSHGKGIRVQYGAGVAPPTYNVGKMGAYPEWRANYSGVTVELKERIWNTAGKAQNSYGNPLAEASQAFKARVERFAETRGHWEAAEAVREVTLDRLIHRATGGKVVPNDAHSGNFGFDYKGRLRAIDPGAYTPPGADVTGAGW